MAKQIDTVTVEVVRNLLMSIAEETYGIIVRSAYSTNMKCHCVRAFSSVSFTDRYFSSRI